MKYFVECKPDEVLVKSLASISRKKITHARNKSRVLKTLTEKQDNSKGLIDEDPRSVQPPSLKKFTEEEDLSEYDIKVLYYSPKSNKLFVLKPRLEEWILKAAKEAEVNVKEYGLPNDEIELHQIINTKLDKFEILIEELKQKSKRLKKLKRLLEGEN